MHQKHFTTFCFLLLSCVLILGCKSTISTTESQTKLEKKSIWKTLETKNHLPVNERIDLYHQLKRDSADAYNFNDEFELNNYGYTLLQAGHKKDAIEIFKLNVEQFPNSSNVYDSLGEAYAANGDKEKSKLNYTKSEDILSILDADKSMGRELFHFPLHFAPQIADKGIEEARFLRGWSDSTNVQFWSYVFAWEVELKEDFSLELLQEKLKLYFDGLIAGVNKDKTLTPPPTTTQFQQLKSKNGSSFQGHVNIYDAFTTKRALKLNTLVQSSFCKQKKMSYIIFRFSPQGFDSEVWTKLKQPQFKQGICVK